MKNKLLLILALCTSAFAMDSADDESAVDEKIVSVLRETKAIKDKHLSVEQYAENTHLFVEASFKVLEENWKKAANSSSLESLKDLQSDIYRNFVMGSISFKLLEERKYQMAFPSSRKALIESIVSKDDTIIDTMNKIGLLTTSTMDNHLSRILDPIDNDHGLFWLFKEIKATREKLELPHLRVLSKSTQLLRKNYGNEMEFYLDYYELRLFRNAHELFRVIQYLKKGPEKFESKADHYYSYLKNELSNTNFSFFAGYAEMKKLIHFSKNFFDLIYQEDYMEPLKTYFIIKDTKKEEKTTKESKAEHSTN